MLDTLVLPTCLFHESSQGFSIPFVYSNVAVTYVETGGCHATPYRLSIPYAVRFDDGMFARLGLIQLHRCSPSVFHPRHEILQIWRWLGLPCATPNISARLRKIVWARYFIDLASELFAVFGCDRYANLHLNPPINFCTPSSRMLPSVIGGPAGSLGFISSEQPPNRLAYAVDLQHSAWAAFNPWVALIDICNASDAIYPPPVEPGAVKAYEAYFIF